MKVGYSYLGEKFNETTRREILEKIEREVVARGDFTLGKTVTEFEEKFAQLLGCKHAIGVANGTDALRISLRLLDVGPGDEVIVPANTFIASVGAIIELFAKPVFVDIGRDYTINADLIEAKITNKTKAILPVHFTGEPCEMDKIMYLADRYDLAVVEDACQAQLAEYKGKMCGTIGDAGCFSLHPLKILNVWGDGGVITTNSDALNRDIRLYRNHGLIDRDTIASPGCNSRLDSVHAAVGAYQLPFTKEGVAKRRANAKRLDDKLKDRVTIIPRRDDIKSCFHLYMFEVAPSIRNSLVAFLNDHHVEAKVHYPIPLYLQKGLEHYAHKRGDFPIADYVCDRVVTLPVDETKTLEQMDYMATLVLGFLNA